MKYITPLVFLLVVATSCTLTNKKTAETDNKASVVTDGSKMIVGAEDEYGCAIEAGYYWSQIKELCVRPFEIGIRLNSIVESQEIIMEENDFDNNNISVFFIFNDDKSKVEVFFPNNTKSILLEQKNLKGLYSNYGWELDTRETYLLKLKNEIKYTAAQTVEMNIIPPSQALEDLE